MIKKVVIPIAGNGTRMYIETMAVSKSLLPVLNKPVIVYILEEAYMAGFTEVLLIISENQKKDVIKFLKPIKKHFLVKHSNNDTLGKFNELLKKISIKYIVQKEQLGLGHAIYCAKDFTKDEDFGVMLGDNLFITPEKSMQVLSEKYKHKKGYYVGVKEVAQEKLKNYGVAISNNYKPGSNCFVIDSLIEKPDYIPAQNTACIGRYILRKSIYEYLEKTKPGVNGEIQLTDALVKAITNEKCYASLIESDFCDTGDKLGFVKTNIKYALKDEDVKDEIYRFIKEIVLKGDE